MNGYWSPGYPALLSVALLLFGPSPAQDFPLVHVVNWGIFVAALWAFTVFLRHWISVTLPDGVANSKKKYVVPLSFATFLFFTLEFIGLDAVTPDLAVAAVVFLAAGMSYRLSQAAASRKHYAAVGAVLGIGYYIKAAMLPLGVALLAILFLLPRSRGVERKKLMLSLCVFLMVAAPLAEMTSWHAGRASFGESGRLNYLWYVNSLPRFTGWTGASSALHGSPEHPPRTLLGRPVVLEFAAPVQGTFPLWYDPVYWHVGAKVTFDWGQQVAAIKVTWEEFKELILQPGVAASAGLLLCILLLQWKSRPPFPWTQWMALAWPLTAFTMYGFVHVEGRFLGAFFVLLWMAAYGAAILRMNRFAGVAAGAIVICVLVQLAISITHPKAEVVRARPSHDLTVATELSGLGLQQGDGLAVVGYPFDAYYARHGGFRVIANVPNADEFWSLGAPELRTLTEQLAAHGVKAVVGWNRPRNSATTIWKDLKISDSQRFSVLVLAANDGKTLP